MNYQTETDKERKKRLRKAELHGMIYGLLFIFLVFTTTYLVIEMITSKCGN